MPSDAAGPPAPGWMTAFASRYGPPETGDMSMAPPLETGLAGADASPVIATPSGLLPFVHETLAEGRGNAVPCRIERREPSPRRCLLARCFSFPGGVL